MADIGECRNCRNESSAPAPEPPPGIRYAERTASVFQQHEARREAAANNPAVKITAEHGWDRGPSVFNASRGKRRIFNREAQHALTAQFEFYYRADLGQYPDFTPNGYTVYVSVVGSGSGHMIGKADTPERAIEIGRAANRALRFAAWLEVDKGE